MTIAEILIYLTILMHFAVLWKIFEKAGRPKWEGFIPIYNYFIWLKILKKPWWWIFLLFIPFVRLIITVALHVETMRLFGRYSAKETILCIVLPWYYLPKIAFDDTIQVAKPTDWSKKEDREKRTLHDHITLFFMAPFIGHFILFAFKLLGAKDKPNKKSMPAEWTDALGFAIVAATIIRTFTFEAFTIPTGSMEKTMLIGDYLFVNKLKYGPKIPETPLSIPFIHNRIPGTMIPSYVEWIKNNYFRLPGYGKIERRDIMVFNWPVGDSVILHSEVVAHDYYSFVRDGAFQRAGKTVPVQGKDGRIYNEFVPMKSKDFEKIKDKAFDKERKRLAEGGGIGSFIKETEGVLHLPNDKKENYIKRCVGIAGDTLSIVNGLVHIDGKPEEFPLFGQYQYRFDFEGTTPFNIDYLVDEYDIYRKDVQEGISPETNKAVAILPCTPTIAEQLKNYPGVVKVSIDFHQKGYDYAKEGRYYPIYPHHPDFDWTRDNFGPLYIPAKGSTIEMNERNYILYKRIIHAYENHTIENRNDEIFIDGKKANQYTFEKDYYWLMGDNRHGSVDSRYWGFVPDDHVVGTASFVWMSKHPEKGTIRWDRIFSFVK